MKSTASPGCKLSCCDTKDGCIATWSCCDQDPSKTKRTTMSYTKCGHVSIETPCTSVCELCKMVKGAAPGDNYRRYGQAHNFVKLASTP
ncbi:hypothetical protein H9P43_009287 [Blastocladiella emersonii ATCC 22665]|nr:hypothetical protein H9P43_009287 [Blastocladiella emersonii ATCC 22665]